MLRYLRNKVKRFIIEKIDEHKLMIGKQLCFTQKSISPKTITDIEFKVFSQWGEDGIIEYIVSHIPIRNKFFIEIGVGNYDESNTRFLMMNRNWGGIIIDASEQDINYVKKREYFWKFDLHPINAFITKENVNEILQSKLITLGIKQDIGLLSIDIDGVDYWVLKEINCIDPQIIICEYNSNFGSKFALTVPYDPNFIRTKKHYSNLYFGASLKAFILLLENRGYKFIGTTSNSNNAFFVKEDLFKKYLSHLSPNEFEVEKARQSRDQYGRLSYLRGIERLNIISDLELIDLELNKSFKIKELIQLGYFDELQY